MATHDPNGWEPDPKKTGNWRAMFEQSRHGGQSPGALPSMVAPAAVPTDAPFDDAALAPDPSIYRPWILQRGGSRPSMMLDFRRYEPRSGLWSGWAIAYPHLVGLEYTGDQMLSLDFSKSQIMIMGTGLDELVRHLQNGSVVSLQEYSHSVWPMHGDGSLIRSIAKLK